MLDEFYRCIVIAYLRANITVMRRKLHIVRATSIIKIGNAENLLRGKFSIESLAVYAYNL